MPKHLVLAHNVKSKEIMRRNEEVQDCKKLQPRPTRFVAPLSLLTLYKLCFSNSIHVQRQPLMPFHPHARRRPFALISLLLFKLFFSADMSFIKLVCLMRLMLKQVQSVLKTSHWCSSFHRKPSMKLSSFSHCTPCLDHLLWFTRWQRNSWH